MLNVSQVRNLFLEKFLKNEITRNETGSIAGADTIEIVGASFIANEPAIFGKPDDEYISHELEWYRSQSLFVDDIPGGPPKIWKAVSSKTHGMINSNYGYLIFNEDNFHQYENALEELLKNPSSRRASMIYTRPSIHSEWNVDGMSDFICTNVVQYFIRNNHMHAVVQMRSNDAWAGYRNDYAWQKYVLEKLTQDYNIESQFSKVIPGTITWQVASLHVYERQFYLLDHFSKTGEIHISKSDYNAKYGS